MDVDNDINELLESRQLRSGTPLRKSDVGVASRRRSMRTKNQVIADKSEQSSTTTRITETSTQVGYSEGRKTPNESDTSADLSDSEREKEKSSRKSYSRRTVINGVSINEEDEDIIVSKSEPQATVSSTATLIQETGYSSEEGTKPRFRAYDVYKSAGTYWDIFPKTDYTYSRSSTDRKEISPGVINPPNMSRRSLHPQSLPVTEIRKKSPTKLHIVKHNVTSRFFSDSKSDGYVSEKLKRWSAIDSDEDEVDVKFSAYKASSSTSSVKSVRSRIVSKLTTVWMYFTLCASYIREKFHGMFKKSRHVEETHFSTVEMDSVNQSSAWIRHQGIMLYWATCFQTWVVAWLLYWLHGGRDQITSEHRQRRKYLSLFLLGLLPLLLLLGGGLISYMKISSTDNISSMLEKVSAATECWLQPSTYVGDDTHQQYSRHKSTADAPFASIDEELIVRKVLNSLEFQKLFQTQKHLETQQTDLEAKFNERKTDEDIRKKAALYQEQIGQQEQLMMEMERIKMHIETFSNQQFNLLRKKIRDLSSHLRLLQEAHIHTIKKMEWCCKQQPPTLTNADIEKHVTSFLSGLFNSEEEAVNSVPDVRNWIQKLFVAKDELEAKLANITQKLSGDVKEAANRSADVIMMSVSEKIREEFIRQHQDPLIGSYSNNVAEHTECENDEGLSYTQVQKIVDQALAMYDADKTGMVDYALESSGGSILSTRCTENYNARTAMYSLMGWFHWYPSGVSPRIVIQPGVQPGNCWAFTGGQGFLVIKLSAWINITAFSIEHIPRLLSPTGKLDSAPKDFRVLGLEHENVQFPIELGKYQYQENGTSLQYFKVQHPDVPPFNIVELQIETNHGNMEYTCLYRFRVHGIRVPKRDLGR